MGFFIAENEYIHTGPKSTCTFCIEAAQLIRLGLHWDGPNGEMAALDFDYAFDRALEVYYEHHPDHRQSVY